MSSFFHFLLPIARPARTFKILRPASSDNPIVLRGGKEEELLGTAIGINLAISLSSEYEESALTFDIY
jgi:hypothetical protein